MGYRTLKMANPTVSYPRDGTETIGGNWRLVAPTPKPEFDSDTHELKELAPINYKQVWEASLLPEAKRTEKLEARAKRNEDNAWEQYKEDKLAHEKSLWVAAGKPVFVP